MAQKKKKKKPGGETGRPAFSEPRIQVFSKFAGCNFQHSTRDFDNLFDSDQDAQTDLMPMLMAIQNNAGVVPMGGIATRQNMVKLFNAPTGKSLTGVVTLVADRLFAACDDMTIHHGLLPDSNVAELDQVVTITDSNSSYGATERFNYSGTVS